MRETPPPAKRRIVSEWNGLEVAILQDHDLRANLVSAIVRAYRRDFAKAKKREARFLSSRASTGQAFAELEAHLRENLNPALERLERLESKVLGHWATSDQLDGNGSAPSSRTGRGKR